MNWDIYKEKIIQQATKQNKNENYVASYLSYVEPLFKQNVPVIVEPHHFALLVGLEYEYVCKMAYASQCFYRSFTIKKSNGTDRSIDEPLPDLKMVQRWILNEILYQIPVSRYAKAFIPKRSIKHNARFHKSQHTVVTIDIKDFFPSINIYHVFKIFNDIGYKKNIAWFLANICCLNQSLPQGAPTSPYISNIVMRDIDDILADYCNSKKYRYTRYADDLTFSGDKSVKEIIPYASTLLLEHKFLLNPSKTRVARQNARQEVTGIVVNHHMQIPKNERKAIRQQLYYIRKYGLDSHLNHINEKRQNYLRHLLGKVNFALFINPYDQEFQAYFSLLYIQATRGILDTKG